MTTAAPDEQLRLLELQACDSALDRLAHRRRTLPELARLNELDGRLASLRDRLVAVRTEESDVAGLVDKAESDIDAVRQRAARDQHLLDTGAVSPARELEHLVAEVASLKNRQAALEDAELELLERLEEVRGATAALQDEADAAGAEKAQVEAGRDAALADIAAEEGRLIATRQGLAADLSAALLTLYEKVRADHDGVGAAALYRGSCQGCRLQLNAGDLAVIRAAPADQVLRCEECRRILVRTTESGI